MKKSVLTLAIALALTGCGMEAKDGEMTGQVKAIDHETPILCYNYTAGDISLGIMRNGTGSMSKSDIFVTVPDAADEALLKKAVKDGTLVKIKYDQARFRWCTPEVIVTGVELLP